MTRLRWDPCSTSEEEGSARDHFSNLWHDSSAESSCSETASCSDASAAFDTTPLLEDDVVVRILQLVKDPADLKACSLVSRRWMRLEGLVRRAVSVTRWDFVDSGRLAERFPNLTSVDLTPAWTGVDERKGGKAAAVMLSRQSLSMKLGPDASSPFSLERVIEEQHPSPPAFDRGLSRLVHGCKDLRRLSVVDVYRLPSMRSLDVPMLGMAGGLSSPRSQSAPSTPQGLLSRGLQMQRLRRGSLQGLEIVAQGSPTLQELDVRQCTDATLAAIGECRNLQLVCLVGISAGFYHATFTDAGLQHLARNCRRIVELSLSGCEVGFEGLAAIGQSCPMLSELSLGGRELRSGWLRALQHCPSLQMLRLEGLKHMDKDPLPARDFGQCPSLVRLELALCDVRPHAGFVALVGVCQGVREIAVRNCWGLEDEPFSSLATCRRLQVLSVEGCSLLTAAGLEGVVVACKDLERLHVTFCSNVKDGDIRGVLAEHMFALKELKWQPEAQRFLLDNLKEAGVGEKGRWLIRGSNGG